jgi:hypothetical protein
VRLTSITKIDLTSPLAKYLSLQKPNIKGHLIFQALVGNMKLGDVSSHLQVSRFKVSRWLSGHTEITLNELLKALQEFSPWFLDFIDMCFPDSAIPSLENMRSLALQRREAVKHFPFLSALLNCLDVKNLGWGNELERGLAEKVGIKAETVRLALKRLCKLKILKIANNHQHYLLDEKFKNLNLDYTQFKTVYEYWQKRALHFLKDASPGVNNSTFAYCTIPVDKEARKRIRKRYLEFHQEVVELAKSCETSEERFPMVMMFSLIDPQECKEVVGSTSKRTAVRA